jgi:hypothetical protein
MSAGQKAREHFANHGALADDDARYLAFESGDQITGLFEGELGCFGRRGGVC